MARRSEGPWFRTAKGAWYAKVGGRQIPLGVKGEDNRRAAEAAWHRLMAGGGGATDGPAAPARPPAPEPSVKAVIDGYLADAEGRVKGNTYRSYEGLLVPLAERFSGTAARNFTASMLLGYANRPGWGSSHRHNLLGAVSTAFRWAVLVGLLRDNPLKGVRRPPKTSRGASSVIPDESHRRVVESATPALRVLLSLLHETGARPSEIARLEAKDIDLGNAVAVLTEHKTAGESARPRLIFLTPRAVELLRGQVGLYPVGPVVRNARGGAWTKDGIGLAVRRACKAAGVKVIAYGYRHSLATTALAKGVSDAQVAGLLGHASTSMLHRHYGHLTSQARAMRQALAAVRGGDNPPTG